MPQCLQVVWFESWIVYLEILNKVPGVEIYRFLYIKLQMKIYGIDIVGDNYLETACYTNIMLKLFRIKMFDCIYNYTSDIFVSK